MTVTYIEKTLYMKCTSNTYFFRKSLKVIVKISEYMPYVVIMKQINSIICWASQNIKVYILDVNTLIKDPYVLSIFQY